MLVRAIEFQENFARVQVEGARQQSLLQRAPELAQQQIAHAGANEQALNLSRPRPTSETENVIVDPDEERSPERGSGGGGRQLDSHGPSPKEEQTRGDTISGSRFDVVV
jgi:hypothetical protein